MSLSATPISAAVAPAPVAFPSSRARAAAARADSGDSVSVDALPASPPAEVIDEMRAAAGAHDRLAAAGQTLQFALDPSTGRLNVTLADLDGNALGAVSPSTVLHVAAGGLPT